jgi:hypothetical protein
MAESSPVKGRDLAASWSTVDGAVQPHAHREADLHAFRTHLLRFTFEGHSKIFDIIYNVFSEHYVLLPRTECTALRIPINEIRSPSRLENVRNKSDIRHVVVIGTYPY